MLFQWLGSATLGHLGQPDEEVSESSDGLEEAAAETQQEVLKQVKFPEVEKDKPLYTILPSISRCITKRVEKLSEEEKKLKAIASPNQLITQ